MGSNKFKFLVTLSWSSDKEHGVQQIQVFGDSLLVIRWIKKEVQIRNFNSLSLYDDIQLRMSTFINICHIYRDKYSIADGLSKAGLGLEQGT
jgi:hypothetical protein